MFVTSLKRVARQGFISFWRNGLVSFTSIFVSAITLFIIGSVVIGNAFLTASLTELESKVDVNVYFTTSADEAYILNLKRNLEALSEVSQVEYLTKEEALARFIERNKGNALVLQSLEELSDNPLGAVLNIKAHKPSQYAGIVDYLNKTEGADSLGLNVSSIDRINYTDNRVVIDNLSALVDGMRKLGMFVSLILVIMSVLVTFGTIRLAIYNSRQEISIMRLVGASNSFIRGPFIIEGIIYGVLAAVLALVGLFPATLWVTRTTNSFFGGVDLYKYYLSNVGQLLVLILVSGIILGMFSSFVAVRRYLKV